MFPGAVIGLKRNCLVIALTGVLAGLPTLSVSYEWVGYINGDATGDQYGSSFCTLDFNSDGYQDLVIGAPASDLGGVSSGMVSVYYGGPDADTVRDLVLTGAPSSFFGKSLASAGDFNGDGAEDLLVGAPFYDSPATNAGAVYLFLGGTNPDTVVDHIFTGGAESDYFGIAVTSGDFNADGFSDIIIGAYKADWGSFVDAGRVYIFAGGSSPEYTVDYTLTGDANGERFGYSLTSGDFNGDGHDDIAVGAYSFDSEDLNVGRVYLFYGGTAPDVHHDLIFQGSESGDKFGWSLASGDVTGDHYDDIVMGSDGHAISFASAGRVYVFDGGPGIDADEAYHFDLGRARSDLLGFSVAAGTDVSSDGIADLLTGMPGNADGGVMAGGAVLLSGGATIEPDTAFYGSSTDEQTGQAVFFWPDFGDGNVAFGAGGHGFDDYRGRVRLFRAPAYNCCVGKVGDVNGDGGAEPTLADVSVLIDLLFISRNPALIGCITEADINQSGGAHPVIDDLSIADISILIDYLFITGPSLGLPDCL